MSQDQWIVVSSGVKDLIGISKRIRESCQSLPVSSAGARGQVN